MSRSPGAKWTTTVSLLAALVVLAASVAVAGWVSTSAAQTDPPPRLDRTIYLQERVLEDPGIDEKLLKEFEDGEPRHVIVQLEELPAAGNEVAVEELTLAVEGFENGFHFRPLGYLSGLEGLGTAYLARVEARDEPPGPGEEVVEGRALQRLLAEDKLSLELPEASEEPIAVLIRFFDDVDTGEAEDVLDRNGVSGAQQGRSPLWEASATLEQVQALAEEDAVQWIEPALEPDLTEVDEARAESNVDAVQQLDTATGAYAGLSGAGVQLSIHDTGVDTSHNDFAGRIIQVKDDGATHGSHVAGIAAGSGFQSDKDDDGGNPNGGTPFEWRGMAPAAEIAAFNSQTGSNAGTMEDAIVDDGVEVSNHSYAVKADGTYETANASIDTLIRGDDPGVPARPQAYSAGNGGVTSQYGTNAGYFSLTKSCKNCIMVGALIDDLTHRNSSSLGPTMDGRLKPDLATIGSSIRSVRSDTGNPANGYTSKSGTSMASPVVAGIVALLLERYADTFGADLDADPPLPSTSKAILVQTAEDLAGTDTATNPDTGEAVSYGDGPDWATGYGLVNAEDAAAMVAEERFLEDSVSAADHTDEHPVSVHPGQTELKLTLAWDDVAGTPNASAIVPQLVNDLDLVLVSPSGETFLPLVLPLLTPNDCDPGTPGVQVGTCAGLDDPDQDYFGPAAPGIDNRNNVEQVVISDPDGLEPGNWTARVSVLNSDRETVRLPLISPDVVQPYSLAGLTTDRADLSVTKVAAPDPVAAGENLTYTVTVTNDGPDPATDVAVLDQPPADHAFVSSSPPCAIGAADELLCSLGDLAAGASTELEIEVNVPHQLVFDAGGPLDVTNTASAYSTVPDPDEANNSASADATVVAVGDLEVVSSQVTDPPDGAPLLIGDSMPVSIESTITNHGPSWPMDTTLTVQASAPAGGTVVGPGSVVTAEPALVPKLRSAEAAFEVSCEAPGAQTFTFTSTIEPANAADTDPDLSNNQRQTSIEVDCVVPIAINIRPGNPNNPIPMPPGQGQGQGQGQGPLVPVAALTTEAEEYNAVHNIANWWLGYDLPVDFDATAIVPDSVRFGERDLVWTQTGGAAKQGPANVNEWHELGNPEKKDGVDDDMRLRFPTAETGIEPGDTEACMRGKYEGKSGQLFSFFGCDFISTGS